MRALFSAIFVFATIATAATNIDNLWVHVITAVDQPRPAGAMHQHANNRVMIYLDAGQIDINHEDGHVEHQHWKAGQVAWSPVAPRHASGNPGDAPIRIVEVELKTKPGHVERDPALDPLTLDPKHQTLEFENDQVRVFRGWREPGGVETMHQHAGSGRVTVLLTDLDGTVKLQDGTTSKLQGKAGDYFWGGPTVHSTTNNGTERFEVVVVEVK